MEEVLGSQTKAQNVPAKGEEGRDLWGANSKGQFLLLFLVKYNKIQWCHGVIVT